MSSSVIEIKPKKIQFDPLAKQVQSSLLENGEAPLNAEVHTERLYKIEGDLTADQIQNVADQLLVDPVVETANIRGEGTCKTKKKDEKKGWVVDVWPKAGVTDPVGETVEKGLRDLGYLGTLHASSGTRYIFPKLKDRSSLQNFATQFLANELIHDIRIRTNN